MIPGIGNKNFSLLEIITVLVIAALAAAIIIPKISPPKGIVRKTALSKIEEAFAEATLRSRATGEAIQLKFNVPDGLITLATDNSQTSAIDKIDSTGSSNNVNNDGTHKANLFNKSSYKLEAKLELTESSGDDSGETDTFTYKFFPGGESGGPDLTFTIAGASYSLSVDNLTGKLTIKEIE